MMQIYTINAHIATKIRICPHIMRLIERELKPDDLKTEYDLSLVAVVGEGLRNKIGVLGAAANALAKSGVNIKLVNQGSSELSIVFGVSTSDEVCAVKALYEKFFVKKEKKESKDGKDSKKETKKDGKK